MMNFHDCDHWPRNVATLRRVQTVLAAMVLFGLITPCTLRAEEELAGLRKSASVLKEVLSQIEI